MIVVIGAGPSALAFAQTVSKTNEKILIIESENDIGGCHRIDRVNGLFTHHSPVIYSSRYLQFKQLLIDLGTNFDSLFVADHIQTLEKYGKFVKQFTIRDMLTIVLAFFFLVIGFPPNSTVDKFANYYQLSDKCKKLLDQICRVSDGCGSNRYSMETFLQLINVHFFYKFYFPREPLDVVLFPLWKKTLESRNVKFLMNTRVVSIIENKIITSTGLTVEADHIICAVPGKSLQKIRGDFNSYNQYIGKSNYETYVAIIFHWSSILQIEEVQNIATETEWGIDFSILSKYTNFHNEKSKTVISTVLTYFDKPYEGVTANECSREQLIKKTFAQLQKLFNGKLPENYIPLISKNVTKNNGVWETSQSAFIKAHNVKNINSMSELNPFVHWLGTQNGYSSYPFTSFESAVSNGIYLAHKLFPQTEIMFRPMRHYTLTSILRFIIFITILLHLLSSSSRFGTIFSSF